jgi:hypothetical protein
LASLLIDSRYLLTKAYFRLLLTPTYLSNSTSFIHINLGFWLSLLLVCLAVTSLLSFHLSSLQAQTFPIFIQ